ncbi:MAG: hypothetical protein COC24_018225 [Alphaproteobacteria bacterium]|nr:hypothetical protein [Alphaproteobacteria bacterium]
MTKNKINWPTPEEDEEQYKTSLPQINDGKISKTDRILLFLFAVTIIICAGLFYWIVGAWTCGISNIGFLDCIHGVLTQMFFHGLESTVTVFFTLLPIPVSIICLYKAIKG